jgi:hypothetical protein
LAFLGVCLVSGLAGIQAQPAQVVLLRHAEKPADDAEVHLSPRGRERAQALVSFFSTNTVFLAHGAPVAIYAPRFEGPRHSRRSFETIAPYALHLGLAVRQPYEAEDYSALAREVLNTPAYRGRTVVICWVRDTLPELAQALGVKSGAKNWKSEVFDRIWTIRYHEGKAALKRHPQRLLPGDSPD